MARKMDRDWIEGYWTNGFGNPGSITAGNTANIVLVTAAQLEGHDDEVYVERIVGQSFIDTRGANVVAAAGIGERIHIGMESEAGAVLVPVQNMSANNAGRSAEERFLWNRFNMGDSGQPFSNYEAGRPWAAHAIDVRVGRKLRDPQLLLYTIYNGFAVTINHYTWLRVLIKF